MGKRTMLLSQSKLKKVAIGSQEVISEGRHARQQLCTYTCPDASLCHQSGWNKIN